MRLRDTGLCECGGERREERYARTQNFRKVRSRDREAITCGTLDFFGCDVSSSLFVTHHIHPLLSHLVAVLSVYELGPGSTPVPRYDGHQLADRVNPRLARFGNWMTPSSLPTCGTRRISRQHASQKFAQNYTKYRVLIFEYQRVDKL